MFPLASAPFDGFDNNENNSENTNIESKKSSKNKTLKKNTKQKPQVAAMMSAIHENSDSQGDLADFNPPPPPKSAGNERIQGRNADSDLETNETSNNQTNTNAGDEPFTPEGYTHIESTQIEDYYRNNIPYYTQMSEQPISNRNELMKKMDKILHLLEEQQDQKTGHATEELVLYSFVGVFIIFIVDSFARAGKYVR